MVEILTLLLGGQESTAEKNASNIDIIACDWKKNLTNMSHYYHWLLLKTYSSFSKQ